MVTVFEEQEELDTPLATDCWKKDTYETKRGDKNNAKMPPLFVPSVEGGQLQEIFKGKRAKIYTQGQNVEREQIISSVTHGYIAGL